MKIRRIRSSLLSYPLAEPLKLAYFGGERTIRKRDAMLIRIETDNGLAGYAPGPASEAAQRAIEECIAPFLEGRSIVDPDALRVQFLQGPGMDPSLVRAYCAVEIGLFDLVGKARGIPVSELLGGRGRDRIRLYGSAGLYMPAGRYAEEAAAISNLGFRAYKMRPGLSPEQGLEMVRQVRQAVGPDFDLMVDAHTWWHRGDGNYPFDQIARMTGELVDHNLAWIEEPFPPGDHQSYRNLRELDLVPLAAGKHEPAEARYLDLILTGCVDYVQMDVVRQGGYPTGRRLLGEIAREGLRFAFHSEGTALDVLAASHLGICWPEHVVEWLEYPCYSTPGQAGQYPFPLAAGILKEPLEIDHGDLVVPRKPGLGIDVDESVVERYPWIPGPWSWFDAGSPSRRLKNQD
ncbi:MAG: mandelate racemase/muconate lactonizing enzyme family protein [Acidobacteria bacterium]|nr:mandelate racemase/muconate lactonizing enzyme family protein [Acidobacteriota bacterium]